MFLCSKQILIRWRGIMRMEIGDKVRLDRTTIKIEVLESFLSLGRFPFWVLVLVDENDFSLYLYRLRLTFLFRLKYINNASAYSSSNCFY